MMKHRHLTKLQKIKDGYFSRKNQIWRDAMFHDVLLAGRVWNIPWFIGLICVAVLYIFSIKRYTKVKLKHREPLDRKSTRLNSSHVAISYAVFCLKKKNTYSRKV